MDVKKKVQLGAHELELRPPPSVTVRYEIAAARSPGARAPHRALAAALAVCCPQVAAWVGGPPFDGDVLAYGARVLDHLINEGARLREVLAAGREAWSLCAGSLPDEAEVQATADFSGAPAAPATS